MVNGGQLPVALGGGRSIEGGSLWSRLAAKVQVEGRFGWRLAIQRNPPWMVRLRGRLFAVIVGFTPKSGGGVRAVKKRRRISVHQWLTNPQ
jgi:hypothetical protein